MSVEDAISQLEMLSHTFYLFQNDESDRPCVVYRRQDGNYGMIELV
jgi:hypothetical protein